AADHVGDAHQVIIHHVGEVVGGHAVGLEQHLHVHLGPGNLDDAPQAIIEGTDALLRDFHADHVGHAGGQPGAYLLLRESETAAVIFRRLAPGHLLAAHPV